MGSGRIERAQEMLEVVPLFDEGHERARRMAAYFDPEQAREAARGTG